MHARAHGIENEKELIPKAHYLVLTLHTNILLRVMSFLHKADGRIL